MENPAAGIMAANHGLVTRDEALDLGLSKEFIPVLVRRGIWIRVRRGVYADPAVWNALDPYRGQPLLLARAALRKMRRNWVLSHDSAAHALELDFLRPRDPRVHITRRGHTNAWTEGGVSHHLAGYDPDQVVEVDGLPCLDHARTAADLAREHGYWIGVTACDSALRMGVPRARLWLAADRMKYWPGVVNVRRAIEFADAGAQTVIESLGRILVADAGIGHAETQFPVRTPEGVVWCDLRVGNHMIELDGKIKYRSPEQGGVADRPAEEVWWSERHRQHLVCAEGAGMSRFASAELFGARRLESIRRLREENAVTVRRFGRELDPRLAGSAAEIRARRTA